MSLGLLSAAERRGTPVLHSATVSENFGNSPQVATPRRPREIDQSTQRFHVGYDNRTIFCFDAESCNVTVDQSAAVTQNAWFRWRSVLRYININTNRGRVLGKVSCTKNLPLGEYIRLGVLSLFQNKHLVF